MKLFCPTKEQETHLNLYEHDDFVRLTSSVTKSHILWRVTPCRLVNSYWSFEGNLCFLLQGKTSQVSWGYLPGNFSLHQHRWHNLTHRHSPFSLNLWKLSSSVIQCFKFYSHLLASMPIFNRPINFYILVSLSCNSCSDVLWLHLSPTERNIRLEYQAEIWIGLCED
jgi:hypothetical protein